MLSKKVSGKRLLLGDILAVLLAILSFFLSLFLFFSGIRSLKESLAFHALKDSGKVVEIVSPSGKKIIKMVAGRHRILKIRGKIGYTVVEINGTAVRFVDSPCPRKLCIKRGWIRNYGESIICMPNQVAAYIEPSREYPVKGENSYREEDIDAITY